MLVAYDTEYTFRLGPVVPIQACEYQLICGVRRSVVQSVLTSEMFVRPLHLAVL